MKKEKLKSLNVSLLRKVFLLILFISSCCLQNYLFARSPISASDNEKSEPLQSRNVSGKVVDLQNMPVIGATIRVKANSNIGAISDGNGNYTLNNVPANAILVVSYVGYETQEIPLSNRSTIDIIMEEDTEQLEDLVVVGYGVQKRSDLTGAISSVRTQDIKNLSVNSMNEALQGRIPGVFVINSNSRPGQEAEIVIRGAASINGLSPLYIVDGVRMSTGAQFNMNDVASIEVLKDAASAAIYGAQAAGGVVLITTKKGQRNEKVSVDLSLRYGIQQPTQLLDLLDTPNFIKARKAMGWNYSSFDNPTALPNTNWMKEVYGNGNIQEYDLSLTGGGQKNSYFVSANYKRDKGMMIDNVFERFGFRINSDYNLGKRLKVGENIYAYKTSENPPMSANIIQPVPMMPVYGENEEWGKTPSEGYASGVNPVGYQYVNHIKNGSYAIESNVFGELIILPELTFRTTLSAAIGTYDTQEFQEKFDFGQVVNPNATFQKTFNKWETYMANFLLTYKKSFGMHNLQLDAIYEALKGTSTNLGGSTSGFTKDVAESFDLATSALNARTAWGSIGNSRVLSQIGRVNYNYNNRYYFTGSVRRDGTDKFGPQNKWGVFPAFNVAWRVSEESFLKDNPVISNFKIRGGYGVLGSDNLGQFLYQPAYYALSAHAFGDGTKTGWGIAKIGNSAIKWEEVRSTNIGTDMGFFSNKLNITFDWYNKSTYDMIYGMSAPPSSGIGGWNSNPGSIPVNLGEIRNRGVEFNIEYQNRFNELLFSAGLNASFNKNEVIKINENPNTYILWGGDGATIWNSSLSKTIAGKPMGQFWGYEVEKIFETDQEVSTLNAASPSGFYQSQQTGAGDLKYKDLNGDKKINADDMTYIGNPWPKAVYGINLKAEYKGVDIAAFFQGVYGIDIYNAAKSSLQGFYGAWNSSYKVFNASFFNGNGLTDQPRFGFMNNNAWVTDPNGNFRNISSYFVEDASYLKLRNLQIGYTLPKSLINKMRISSARIYISGQNIFTITGYSGLDPEIGGYTTSRGIDVISNYLHSRSFYMGANLSF